MIFSLPSSQTFSTKNSTAIIFFKLYLLNIVCKKMFNEYYMWFLGISKLIFSEVSRLSFFVRPRINFLVNDCDQSFKRTSCTQTTVVVEEPLKRVLGVRIGINLDWLTRIFSSQRKELHSIRYYYYVLV